MGSVLQVNSLQQISKMALIFAIFTLLIGCTTNDNPDTPADALAELDAPPTMSAILSAVQGTVAVNGQAAQENQELVPGDVIVTAKDSSVQIVFNDGAVTRLDESTEIVFDEGSTTEDISITQILGRTYNRILKVSGIGQFEVITPHTAATVRGTGFAVRIEDAETWIDVTDGEVDVAEIRNTIRSAAKRILLNERARISHDKENTRSHGDFAIGRFEPDKWTRRNTDEDVRFRSDVHQRYIKRAINLLETSSREEILKEHPDFVERLRKAGITRDEIEQYLRKERRTENTDTETTARTATTDTSDTTPQTTSDSTRSTDTINTRTTAPADTVYKTFEEFLRLRYGATQEKLEEWKRTGRLEEIRKEWYQYQLDNDLIEPVDDSAGIEVTSGPLVTDAADTVIIAADGTRHVIRVG